MKLLSIELQRKRLGASPRRQGFAPGFTLVELLVTVAIMTVVLMGFAQMIFNSNKAQNNVTLTGAIDSYAGLIALQLQDPNQCAALMTGSGQQISTGPQVSNSITLSGSLPTLPTGVTLGSIKIQNELSTAPTSPTTSWPAQLILVFNKSTKVMTGAPQVTRTLPLTVTTALWSPSGPATMSVTGCVGTAIALSTRQQACSDLGGNWNASATPPCVLPAVPTSQQGCLDSNGTWNASANPPCNRTIVSNSRQQACLDSGGSWNASATPPCALPYPTVPSGAVMAFTGACPTPGWSPYAGAKGRMIIGADAAYSLGVSGGSPTHTLSASELPNHQHEIYNKQTGAGGSWGNILSGGGWDGNMYTRNCTNCLNHPFSIMNPYIALNYCVKN